MKLVTASALLAMSLPGFAEAHRLDEYLQATLIGVKRNAVEVEIRMTPGVSVLPLLLAAIDQNADGVLSEQEERAYAERVAREVGLQADGSPANLRLVDSRFPDIEQMRQGLGTIELKLRADASGRSLRFENRHLPQISVYLVNCLASPSDGLVISRQERDQFQRSIQFGYSFPDDITSRTNRALMMSRSALLFAVAILLSARLTVLLWQKKTEQ